MTDLLALPPRDEHGAVHVVVESPAGATVKLKYDPKLRVFMVSRPLVLGLRYPHDWGFVPGTRAEDGDPLDALVVGDTPTYPGVVHVTRPIALLKVTQRKKKGKPGERERNDRIIAVSTKAFRDDGIEDLTDLPDRVRAELSLLFEMVVGLEQKEICIEGWGDRVEAEAVIDEGIAAAASGPPI